MISGLIAVLVSILSACAGAVLARLAAERRNRRERLALGREMTRQVHERYEAYCVLEERVTHVIGNLGWHT